MERYLDLLLRMPLFYGIRDKKDLAWVLKCVDGEVKEYRAGDAIFEKGENVYFAGMVISGILQMEGEGGLINVDAGGLIPIPYESGKSAEAPAKVTAKTDSRVLFLRWIRLMKLCNFECAFHKQLIENIQRLMG